MDICLRQNPMKRHFAKLHEKIQNKYNEMQRKIEKSRSVDILDAISDECLHNESTKFVSTNDLTDEVFNSDSDRSSEREVKTVVFEDVNQKNVTVININCKEASITEIHCPVAHKEVDGYENFEDSLFNELKENELTESCETINDIGKNSDENVITPVTSPQLSLRSRIGSRISAARERRRKRILLKDNKKEMETATKVEKFILSNSNKTDSIFPYKKTKIATVTIALIEMKRLENDALEDKIRAMYCRFKLGVEKHKSKTVKSAASVVKWQELFNMNMCDDRENNNILEITAWDHHFLIGRTFVDLTQLEKEKTHRIKTFLEGSMPTEEIFLLLTITGTPCGDILIDLNNYEDIQRRLEAERRKFAWYHLNNFSEIGYLSIIVYGAKGLSAHDCYCSLKLGNERRQTHIDNKTNEPNWMKMFTFKLTDVTSILEITVIDERKGDDIGHVSIPLLRINNENKTWYALKDSTQRERAKGNNPRILLEMKISWNLIKASVRVINPKEADYLEVDDKFDRRLFAKNLARTKSVVTWVLSALSVVKTCFEWESRKWNTIALIAWLLFHWFFKPWMVAMLFLVPFMWYRPQKYYIVNWKNIIKFGKQEDIHEPRQEKEERVSLRKKLNNLHDMVQTVQNSIGKVASLGESIKKQDAYLSDDAIKQSTLKFAASPWRDYHGKKSVSGKGKISLFNFSVPYLSFLSIFAILVIAYIMYLVPTKYIFMGWGIHKYTRKILRPNRIPNNEILDLLSRVPDDEVLLDCEELPFECETNEVEKS